MNAEATGTLWVQGCSNGNWWTSQFSCKRSEIDGILSGHLSYRQYEFVPLNKNDGTSIEYIKPNMQRPRD